MTTSSETPRETISKSLGGFFREPRKDVFPPTFLYGPTGAGKTYLSATATQVPARTPVALIAIERTDETLGNKPDIDLSQLYLIDPVAFALKSHISNMWDACAQAIRKVRDMKPFPFKTVVVDGLTTLQFHAEQRTQTETPFHRGDSVLLELTQQGDYRLVKERILPLIMDLAEVCDANKAALILTANERGLKVPYEGEAPTDSDGRPLPPPEKSAPALMPSLIDPLLGMFAIVGKMRVSGKDFVMETRRGQYRDAKDRTGTLVEQMKAPSIAMITEQLKKGGWEL